jgi:hypothetical protein
MSKHNAQQKSLVEQAFSDKVTQGQINASI